MRRNRPKRNSAYWIISALIHVVLLVLLFLSPAGQSIFRKDRPLKPEIVREDEELAEVIDDIRDLAVDRLKAQVQLLEGGRERMAANFHTLNEHYEPFVAKQIEFARDRLVQEGSRVSELQHIILKAAERAAAEGEGASDPMWRAYDGNRAALVAGQEEIRRALMLTASEDTELVELQNQAEADQLEVFSLISKSVSAQNHLWGAPKHIERDEGRIAKYQEAIAMYSGRIESAQKKIAEYQADIKESKARLAETKAELDQAQEAYNQAKAGKEGEKEARSAYDRANRIHKQAESGLRKAEKRLEQAEKSLASSRSRLADAQKRLAGSEKSVAERKEALPDKVTQRDESAAAAAALQRTAIERQQEVYDRLLAQLDRDAKEAERTGATTDDSTEGASPAPQEDVL